MPVVASTAPHFLHPLISYNIAHDPLLVLCPIRSDRTARADRISDKHPPDSDTLVVCIKFHLKYSPGVKLFANNGVPKVWHEWVLTIMMITGHHRFSHRMEAIITSCTQVIAGYSQFLKQYYSNIHCYCAASRESHERLLGISESFTVFYNQCLVQVFCLWFIE